MMGGRECSFGSSIVQLNRKRFWIFIIIIIKYIYNDIIIKKSNSFFNIIN